jgi:hypothetical protein
MLRRVPAWGVFLLALAPSLALGASGDSGSLRGELDTIYQRLLGDPSDRALNRRLIDIAVQLNDYDAAIGAVERLIFYEPGNAALQLEAARFYVQIKSYAAAAGYLKGALELPNLTGGERKEASDLLAVTDRETRPSPWSAFIQAGARYQTNANNGSAELGLNEPLPFQKPKEDWNSFALGTLGLAEPINKNLGIESSLSGYYADQDEIDRLDLAFAEITAGPRFTTDKGELSLKPYALAQGISLGNDPYQAAFGGGVLTRWTFADDWWIEPQFEYKNRSYYNSDNYPLATDQTGELFTYAVNFNGRLSDNVGWSSRLAFNNNDAAAAYQSYDQYFANIGVQIGFDLFGVENLLFSPYAGVTMTNFNGIAPPEKYAGLDTIREDFQWVVGANLEVPLREHIALGLAVEYAKNRSNLDRDDYENLKVVIGPEGRF